ncbi:hypothetical protein Glove_415g7 [Diversispora epigaea]|uniref:Uncharacterized protein n=1 Tax=Diversispora epigaea TaxID=1348612 RepID=A0A397H188_9GLOM|nr:hypothetical protein Glove_415g7 [Diversispora epigaea]
MSKQNKQNAVDIQILKFKLSQLEKKFQETDVLISELLSLKPNATIYYQKSDTNIFFMENNKQLIKDDKKKNHAKLKKEIDKIKEKIKKLEAL